MHFNFVCFWARLYVTATEIRQVQSFCIIYIHTFIIIIHIHNHVYRYRKPLQPMLKTPITTGALSPICIYIAFQKVPNLFLFMLNPASRHRFSLFSNSSVSFPPPPKKKKTQAWLPTFLSCLTNICVSPWQEADSVPHHWPVCFCCLVCLFLPALIPVVQVPEEVCTVVLNILNTSPVDHYHRQVVWENVEAWGAAGCLVFCGFYLKRKRNMKNRKKRMLRCKP